VNEVVTMTLREIDRLKVIDQVLKGKLNRYQASEQLKLSRRQIIRLCKRVKKEANIGIIHRLRGKASNRSLAPEILSKVAELIKKKYSDFGPTLAAEKLAEFDGLSLSTSTVRRTMVKAELWKPRRVKTLFRTFRQRRACLGELIQVDGSHHDWFEGRAARCVLIVFIDDATSRILLAKFVDSESTLHLMRLTGKYLLEYGRPLAVYVDKDSIFRVNRQPTVEEQLRDDQPATQFSRAMEELNIEVIFANSPQAKGRVERSFKTHQDRLVKELRIRNISDQDTANRFLEEIYLPDCNRRFSVLPLSERDAHRKLQKNQCLQQILSIRSQRTLFNDYTIRFQNRFFQIQHQPGLCIRPKQKVHVEVRLDSSLHIRFNGRYLKFVQIAKPLSASMHKQNLIQATNKPPRPSKENVDRHRYFPFPRQTWAKLHQIKRQYKRSLHFPQQPLPEKST
jgi:hypothetical protein